MPSGDVLGILKSRTKKRKTGGVQKIYKVRVKFKQGDGQMIECDENILRERYLDHYENVGFSNAERALSEFLNKKFGMNVDVIEYANMEKRMKDAEVHTLQTTENLQNEVRGLQEENVRLQSSLALSENQYKEKVHDLDVVEAKCFLQARDLSTARSNMGDDVEERRKISQLQHQLEEEKFEKDNLKGILATEYSNIYSGATDFAVLVGKMRIRMMKHRAYMTNAANISIAYNRRIADRQEQQVKVMEDVTARLQDLMDKDDEVLKNVEKFIENINPDDHAQAQIVFPFSEDVITDIIPGDRDDLFDKLDLDFEDFAAFEYQNSQPLSPHFQTPYP